VIGEPDSRGDRFRGGIQVEVGAGARTWHREGYVNDPSAGSPTETLLRLLLPLNEQV
jgi:hypothetical protein